MECNNRKDNVIKHLKMMGYTVLENPKHDSIHISITTKSGYGMYYVLFEQQIYEDFIIEHVVSAFNKTMVDDI